jgi:hypothetical protein
MIYTMNWPWTSRLQCDRNYYTCVYAVFYLNMESPSLLLMCCLLQQREWQWQCIHDTNRSYTTRSQGRDISCGSLTVGMPTYWYYRPYRNCTTARTVPYIRYNCHTTAWVCIWTIVTHANQFMLAYACKPIYFEIYDSYYLTIINAYSLLSWVTTGVYVCRISHRFDK